MEKLGGKFWGIFWGGNFGGEFFFFGGGPGCLERKYNFASYKNVIGRLNICIILCS
jgi:hypothetical protein